MVIVGDGIAIQAETLFKNLSELAPKLDEDSQIDEIEMMIASGEYATISPESMKNLSLFARIVEQPDRFGKLN